MFSVVAFVVLLELTVSVLCEQTLQTVSDNTASNTASKFPVTCILMVVTLKYKSRAVAGKPSEAV